MENDDDDVLDSDSTDSNFNESDYDMEDDDNVVFEVNVDWGIKKDIGEGAGANFGIGALVVVGPSVEGMGGHGVDGSKYEKS